MNFSIETRVPFVDYNVIELAFSLPFDYKVHEGWSKYILRKSAESKLPEEVVWRSSKIGFEAPKNWLPNKEILFQAIRESPFIKEFVDIKMLSKDVNDVSLWKLYNLAVWARKFNVQFG
jgi:asparagine synthase (glutamine-hydrolysing)